MAAALLIVSGAWFFNGPVRWRADASPHVLTLPPMDEAVPAAAHHSNELWVCTDPDNLPFSNAAGEGFENQLAAMMARGLRRELRQSWQPAGSRFARKALAQGDCDLIVGTPAETHPGITRPYYRSSYVFVTRAREPPIVSFADPRLHRVTVGVQLSGDDGEAPPARAMAAYRRTGQIRGFVTNSLVADSAPARRIIDAVAAGEIAAAAVWGPLAGYYAADQRVPLVVTPIARASDSDPQFTFDIAMATRGDDAALVEALDQVLETERRNVQRILRAYHVPLLPLRTPDRSAPMRGAP
jgi:mxaJ protein